MSRIALVTDSTCDLPEVVLSRLHPTVVPLHYVLGGSGYLDRVDMDYDAFYARFAENGQVATTSQPSVGEFVEVYRPLLTEYDAVVSVHISSRMSGTVESALGAAQSLDPARIRVVDSKHVSVGLGAVVEAAGEAILSGADLDSVVATAETAARLTRVYGAVPDLEVAVKGGRVSAPAAVVAGFMDIKPLIAFTDDGVARIAGARRGFRRALQAIGGKVVRYAADHPSRVMVVHANGFESAQGVQERLRADLPGLDIPIVKAGAVITSHTGLGTVAVSIRHLEDAGPER